jgi:N-carbamoylputrescine amidase
MKVTICEMNDDPRLFERDWERLSAHVRRAQSDLVLLPEMPFYYWFCASRRFEPDVWREAVRAHGRWAGRLKELGAPAVLCSRPAGVGRRRLNEGFVWKEGRAKGVHYKSYLPDEAGYYEASWYDRGDRVFSAFDVEGLKTGFMICSELWSMGDARGYGSLGTHLIAVPRTTGRASLDKWVAGGKTAAVVSGAYCLSSNRRGRRGEATFGGCGWAFDPDGKVLGLTSRAKPFVTVEVDPRVAEKAKKTYPRYSFGP